MPVGDAAIGDVVEGRHLACKRERMFRHNTAKPNQDVRYERRVQRVWPPEDAFTRVLERNAFYSSSR